jgi:hypothetical protein
MLKSEFIKKVADLFGPGGSYSDYRVDIDSYDPVQKTLNIRVKQMYEFVEVTFDKLCQLSELTGTRHINLGDKVSYGGCETCDHGSSYEVSIHLKEVALTLEDDPKTTKTRRRR